MPLPCRRSKVPVCHYCHMILGSPSGQCHTAYGIWHMDRFNIAHGARILEAIRTEVGGSGL